VYKGQYKYNQKSYHYPLYEVKVENPLFKIEDLNGLKKQPEIKYLPYYHKIMQTLKFDKWTNYAIQKSLL
jgi:hypothetical protein